MKKMFAGQSGKLLIKTAGIGLMTLLFMIPTEASSQMPASLAKAIIQQNGIQISIYDMHFNGETHPVAVFEKGSVRGVMNLEPSTKLDSQSLKELVDHVSAQISRQEAMGHEQEIKQFRQKWEGRLRKQLQIAAVFSQSA